jgi:valyl-tRNA synthetase
MSRSRSTGRPALRGLIGRLALVPFVDRAVPIIADPIVQPEFGTGAVKSPPAHDPDDYATGKRHDLPAITVMDGAARMTDAAGPYAGLDRFEARARILADLEARGDLVEARPHELIIGRCQRSNDII